MATKIELVTLVFKEFHQILDDIFERLKVKWFLLSILQKYNEPVYIEIIDSTSQEAILQINYPAGKIKEHHNQMESELRRIFINDLYSNCEYFSTYLDCILKNKHTNGRYEPAFAKDKYDQPLNQLNRFLNNADKKFLQFFRKSRNSMIHSDGQHNQRNELSYKILNTNFITTKNNLGEHIMWGPKEMIEIYKVIKKLFDYDKFEKNALFQKEIL